MLTLLKSNETWWHQFSVEHEITLIKNVIITTAHSWGFRQNVPCSVLVFSHAHFHLPIKTERANRMFWSFMKFLVQCLQILSARGASPEQRFQPPPLSSFSSSSSWLCCFPGPQVRLCPFPDRSPAWNRLKEMINAHYSTWRTLRHVSALHSEQAMRTGARSA